MLDVENNPQATYDELKGLLGIYSLPLEARSEAMFGYSLYSVKSLVFGGRKRDELFFAGLSLRKGYVSLHIMALYANPDLLSHLKPVLLKCKAGKACFSIKRLDEPLREAIQEALGLVFSEYQQQGWV